MKTTYLVIIFLTIGTQLYGSNFDRTGYVKGKIYTKSDTINCYVKFADRYFGNIKYKLSLEKKIPSIIHSHKIEHLSLMVSSHFNIYYDRISYKGISYLMKRVCSGKINFYKRVTVIHNAPMSTTSTVNFPLVASREVKHFYLIKNGITVKIKKNWALHETLKELMSDHKSVYLDINKLKYKRSVFEYDLELLVKKYNTWFE